MQTFSDIIGQNSIIGHLSDALRTGEVSHAYILSGDTGSGRRTIARAFAAALQCENLQWETPQQENIRSDGSHTNLPHPGTIQAESVSRKFMLPRPCGRCLSCLQAETSNQPDIITVSHEKPNSIGVDEIRQMRSDIQIKPYANPYKVYIIPDAEKLTVQAQNALLKTLEEPPSYAVLLLIANGTENFLPTVLSRCILLRMRAVSESQIADFLLRQPSQGGGGRQSDTAGPDFPKGGGSRDQDGTGSADGRHSITPDQAQVIARFAGGNPGRALQLVSDESFLALRDKTIDLLQHLRDTDISAISAFVSETDAAQREDLMNFVMMWYRDILVFQRTGASDNLIFGEDLQYIIEAAGMLSGEALGMIMDTVAESSRRLRSNVAADAVLETMFLRIRAAYARRQ